MPPAGIKLTDVFQVPSGANSSVIESDDLDIVEITADRKNQAGAIWNTDGNMMDLTKDFKTSMYLYFGDRGEKAADGMAFVMQADKNKNKAFRTGEGARLGVWDSASYKDFGMAIMNSFAVEFDTHYNSEFDAAIPKGKNHIAWGYPGKKSTYHDEWKLIGSYRWLNHEDPIFPKNNYLSDGKWHHFVVKWDAERSTLTYQFDTMRTISIPIDVKDVFGTSQVYWGFTGSTGSDYANNRVVFEEIPELLEGETKEKIVDQRDGKSIEGKEVHAEDVLTYEIDTQYLKGKTAWKDVFLKKKIESLR
ncbi:legume lectin domain-containing protein [Listeria floridensis FSL S10-1187]|uniref:Legume lectin domain-containing protein n=1 Tax=Listeria floridensis FSL S10-1187 TaxID=1265817 RepID=A0ABP3AVX9_9LIST|nr:L-type lectin-domain containing protein [Listeria floridensis]EUJ28479.1 legume lectin domain-containing protein [Listeria floridensis FSL S10-1187]